MPKLLASTFAEIILENQYNVIVACIYKHPSLSISDFNTLFMAPFLSKISLENKSLVLMGDYNINLLNSESENDIGEYIDLLGSNLLLPTISLPTRVTNTSQTLIDNILITPSKFKVSSGNLVVSLSDHFPQFLIFDSPAPTSMEIETFYRDWNSFDEDQFKHDFQTYDWHEKLELHKEDPDISFDIFYDAITILVDQYAPMKKLTKKQLKSKYKPWLTRGIKKAIYHRNKLRNLQLKTNDPDLKKFYENEYKIYRNHIVNIIRISKNIHYRQYFTNNINNSKMTWKGINEITKSSKVKNNPPISLEKNNSLISDTKIVALKFNKHSSSVAEKIRKNIPHKPSTFKNYLTNSPANSCFLTPTNNIEIIKIIKSLDQNKSTVP